MADRGRRRSGSGTAGGGRKGGVEYTRVVPKFLREMMRVHPAEHDSFCAIPSTRRAPGETPSVDEIDALRREGFNVDVEPETAPITPAKPTRGDTKSEADRNGDDGLVEPPKPPSRSKTEAAKDPLRVAAHRVTKPAHRRASAPQLASKNRSRLSFAANDSSEDDSDDS